MKNIWEFYEKLKEMVYVSDMDTDELIYMNKYGRDYLGIQSLEEIKGQHCYRILKGLSEKCTVCTNNQLKQGEFLEWMDYNPTLDKTYMMKTTMIEQDGRRYRLELSIDISEHAKHKQTVKAFSSNEMMVNTAIRLALEEITPEKSIGVLLKHLGQSLNSDRVYIFEETPEHQVDNTYEWCAEGVEPQIDYLQNVPWEVVQVWYDVFESNENIIIKDLESVKESDSRLYDILAPQQIRSLVVSPIKDNGKIIGFYGVDNPPMEILDHISVMFMVLGYFMTTLIKRRDLMKRMEKMSFYDQLTGGLNRHGMNKFVEEIDPDANIGLVYCDVMGLKRVNDLKGHAEGDALLIRAYNCMVNSFSKNMVFRIGGDEFLVISSGMPKEALDKKVEELKKSMADYQVDFAIGTVWEPKCDGQIEKLLHIADQRMYEDKEAYYSLHPNDRRAR